MDIVRFQGQETGIRGFFAVRSITTGGDTVGRTDESGARVFRNPLSQNCEMVFSGSSVAPEVASRPLGPCFIDLQGAAFEYGIVQGFFCFFSLFGG